MLVEASDNVNYSYKTAKKGGGGIINRLKSSKINQIRTKFLRVFIF